MKKIFVLIVILFILILNFIYVNNDFSLINYFPTGQLTKYSNCEENALAQILPNVYITNTNKHIIGESMYFDNLEVASAIDTLNAKVVFTESLTNEQMILVYCYSTLVPDSVEYKGKKINLQFAISNTYTVIGWPMILGSF